MAFPFQRSQDCLTAAASWLVLTRLTLFVVALCLTPNFLRLLSTGGGAQFYARPPGLRQTDGDRLFCRARTVLACPNMMKFFADKFAGLGGRCLALPLVLADTIQSFLIWHTELLARNVPMVEATDVPEFCRFSLPPALFVVHG